MDSNAFGEILISIADNDFKQAIKLVGCCLCYINDGISIDQSLSDCLYSACKDFILNYDKSLNGK